MANSSTEIARSSVTSHDQSLASSFGGLSEGAIGGGRSSKRSIVDTCFGFVSASRRFPFEQSWKLQSVVLLYSYGFLSIYMVHPMWGYSMQWTSGVARWALRIQGHGWALTANDEGVLVRTHLPMPDLCCCNLSPIPDVLIRVRHQRAPVLCRQSKQLAAHPENRLIRYFSTSGASPDRSTRPNALLLQSGLLACALVLTSSLFGLAVHLAWANRRKRQPFKGELALTRALELVYMKMFG